MQKPQILVVHGALGSAAQMDPIACALEEVGTVDNIELSGHGTTVTERNEDFSMLAFAAQLRSRVQVASQNGAAAPVIFGYSMGGYAALLLESQLPGTFSGIVTLGTKFAWTPELALRECARLDPAMISAKVPKFAALLADRHLNAGGWETLLQRTAALLTDLGNAPLLTRESMDAIAANVCVAVGENDETVSADECAEFASYMPLGTSAVVPGVPHPIERVPVTAIVELVRRVLPATE